MKHWKKLLFPLLICLVGIAISCKITLFSGFQQMQTDPGDTRFNNYILEHEYLWAQGEHSSFWDPPIFFPAPNTLAYSDILLGSAPIYGLIRLFGFLPDTSYQLWTFSLLGLNFFFALLFFQELGFAVVSSIAASYLFAFANMRIAQIGHPQLLPQFYTFLALFALLRAFKAHQIHHGTGSKQASQQVRTWILGFGFAVVAQIYSGFYLGWFVIFGLFWLMSVAFIRRNSRPIVLSFVKTHWEPLLFTALLSIALLAPMAWHYWIASQEVGMRSYAEVSGMLPLVQSWFYMGKDNLLYGFLDRFSLFQKIPMAHEQRAGVGFITFILITLGFFWNRRKLPSQLAWGVILAIGLCCFYTGRRFFPHEAWELIYAGFPGAKAIRAVSRISFLILVPASLGLAYFFEGIKKKPLLCFSFLALVALEQITSTASFDKLASRQEVQALAQKIPAGCGAFYYSPLTNAEPAWKLQIDAMWASINARIPTINGYSGNIPPGWGGLNQNGNLANQDALQAYLNIWSRSNMHQPFRNDCWITQ